MLRSFAFIHLPADDNAQSLQQKRPFLHLCIVAVATKTTSKKMALFKEIRHVLAQAMLLEDGRNVNIDLLLGLLTYLVWYGTFRTILTVSPSVCKLIGIRGNEQLLSDNPKSLSRFTQMATTIVFELRLNKPSQREVNMLPKGNPGDSSARQTVTGPTLEDRRAVLGCFVMSSM